MFTGGTAKYVIDMLHTKGFSILKFIPGLQVSDVSEISGVPVEPIEKFDPADVVDIVDPRDFLFGLTEAGLAIKDNGVLYRTPYVEPWVNLTARASVPHEQAKALSYEMMGLNGWFYTKLGQLAGKDVAVYDTAPSFQTFVTHNTDYPLEGHMKAFCDYSKDLLE
jgi:hypothetical protein